MLETYGKEGFPEEIKHGSIVSRAGDDPGCEGLSRQGTAARHVCGFGGSR